ncbi:MAG: sugar phosphate isomerase/epimerase [Zavarzinella sp.]
MARPITLFSNQWLDLPLDLLASKVNEWGYGGLELSARNPHFNIQEAEEGGEYLDAIIALLAEYELSIPVVSFHQLSQVIGDPIDSRHQSLVSERIWGEGKPQHIRQRAIQELLVGFRFAKELGASTISGFTGSPMWSAITGYPGPTETQWVNALNEFAATWNPILDHAKEIGVCYAFEIHPGQLAFDYYSAERLLDAIHGRPEFGFTIDPSHFLWQGLDPVAFIHRFADRIYHVHLKDTAITLNGRSGLLNSGLPSGDPHRGWQFRCPGRGGVDWEAFIRALNDIQYSGAMSVEFHDRGMDREFGAREAFQFAHRLNFPAPTTNVNKNS